MQEENDIKPARTNRAMATAPPERMTVDSYELIEEFGPEEGKAKYFAIGRIEKEMSNGTMGRVWHDTEAEWPGYRPRLVVATQPPEVRAEVMKIINTPQVKES